MRFEKWQALGNDYLILEADALPFELSPPRVRVLCEPHTGVACDGVLLLSEADQEGFVARLRIFNPDGSESGLSGNGAREAIMYLRRHGRAGGESFSIQTGAGEVRAQVTSETSCTIDIGRVRLQSADFPTGAADGHGELAAGGRSWSFQHVAVGNPQCAIAMSDFDELQGLDLPAIGPAIERHELFPNRTNVSWFCVRAPGRIRARIFERGVGETASSGTGATGAAVAYVLAGGDSPVTVELDGGELTVVVGEDLHVDLSGPAVPVYCGALAPEMMEVLHAAQ